MLRVIVKAIGVLAVVLFFLAAGVLVLGFSLGAGFLLGSLLSALFHLPMWLSVTACTIFFALFLAGPLLGWWEERERRFNLFPLLVALWLGHKIGSGDKGEPRHE